MIFPQRSSNTVMMSGALKALVIDDSPADAQTLSYLLSKRFQTQVDIANDGLERLDKLSAGRFDLVFLDLQMRGNPHPYRIRLQKSSGDWAQRQN